MGPAATCSALKRGHYCVFVVRVSEQVAEIQENVTLVVVRSCTLPGFFV